MQTLFYKNPTANAFIAAILSIVVLTVSFFTFEPLIAHGIVDTFTVRQQITSDIAFKTTANDVTMTPALSGITGGNAFGTSTVAVITNNTTGYNMTINFATTTALQGGGVSSDIDNYTPVTGGTPDYNFAMDANDAEFAYTVNGVTTPSDIDARFKDNGIGACNTGSGTLVGKCWHGTANAVTPVGIINRLTATPGTGATSTIVFQVGITANPSPAIIAAFYTATATLTAVTN